MSLAQEVSRLFGRVTRSLRSKNWTTRLSAAVHPSASRQLVLGIESSCDDTGAAIVDNHGHILGEALASQAEVHKAYGGVVPDLARAAHAEAIDRVVDDAMHQAGVSYDDLDAIAVTIGPGLSLCLRVGVLKARAMSTQHKVPLVNCHHMEAHALVARMGAANLQFPFICMLISGGHNMILLVRGVGDYTLIGTTLDDAIGEAYDKIARLLGLELTPSGGPALEAFAKQGDPTAFRFTLPMAQKVTCDFSYAGLKTAVRLAIEEHVGDDLGPATAQVRADIAASFQAVAVQQLAVRLTRAIDWARELDSDVKHVVVSGGVASNAEVRRRIDEAASEAGLHTVYPPVRLCTDNGVMVAWAGQERFALGLVEEPPACSAGGGVEEEWVEVKARWPLTSEKHPRCAPPRRKKPRRRPTDSKRAWGRQEFVSLTDLTRQSLLQREPV